MSIKVSGDQNTVTIELVAVEYEEHYRNECIDCALYQFDCCNIECNKHERKDNRNVIFKLKSEVENELD